MYRAVDMHCDTISGLWRAEREGKPMELRDSSLCVDLQKMQKGGYLLQNFAMFVFMGREADPLVNVLELIDEYYRQMEKNQDMIAPVYCYQDILNNQAAGKLSGLLTIEEGGVLKGSIPVLRNLYRLGVRMLTLTWNFENEIGYPHTIVTEKDYDPSRRYVASHSNARAVCGHTRNLTDDMIRALADKGGVMGINFCDSFLSHQGPGTVEDMIRHIRHIKNVGGIGCIGLGTDFDGIDNVPEVQNAADMPLLAQGMEQAGFTDDEIDAVFSGNVLRLYREVLK